MSFNVYKVRYKLGIQDPDMQGTRYHTVIFVETHADGPGSGVVHHVTGDLVTGMKYEKRKGERPEDTLGYHDKQYLGTMNKGDYPDAIDTICEAQPAPPKQKRYNPATNRTEQFNPDDGSFFAPGQSRPPMTKCTEWTVNQAIPALQSSGLLH